MASLFDVVGVEMMALSTITKTELAVAVAVAGGCAADCDWSVSS